MNIHLLVTLLILLQNVESRCRRPATRPTSRI